jgi:hypothetical protein
MTATVTATRRFIRTPDVFPMVKLRPNDTTVYATSDCALSPWAITVPASLRGGRRVTLRTAWMTKSNSIVNQGYSLFVFSANPASWVDNSPIALTDAEIATYLGLAPSTVSLNGASATFNLGAGALGRMLSFTSTIFDLPKDIVTVYLALMLTGPAAPLALQEFQLLDAAFQAQGESEAGEF